MLRELAGPGPSASPGAAAISLGCTAALSRPPPRRSQSRPRRGRGDANCFCHGQGKAEPLFRLNRSTEAASGPACTEVSCADSPLPRSVCPCLQGLVHSSPGRGDAAGSAWGTAHRERCQKDGEGLTCPCLYNPGCTGSAQQRKAFGES